MKHLIQNRIDNALRHQKTLVLELKGQWIICRNDPINRFDHENLLGPGVGDINLQMHPEGNRLMEVRYFDVSGFGLLDPAEYGNYLAGWTTAVIENLTGRSECVLNFREPQQFFSLLCRTRWKISHV